MIVEPYICIEGRHVGEIHWLNAVRCDDGSWQPYADFERQKLRELGGCLYQPTPEFYGAYTFHSAKTTYFSAGLIDYEMADYRADSESNRLLKRAEFLKAVCEKEGVGWLPKEKCCEHMYTKCDKCIVAALDRITKSSEFQELRKRFT